MKKWLITAAALLLLAACNSGNSRKIESLDEAIIRYAQALRWGRYQDAQEFQRDRSGEKWKIDEQALEHIRITRYVVQESNLNDDITEADVNVVLEYFNDSKGTVRKVPFRQTWWYEPKSKRWFVEGELPEF
jgi:hypothetical protein